MFENEVFKADSKKRYFKPLWNWNEGISLKVHVAKAGTIYPADPLHLFQKDMKPSPNNSTSKASKSEKLGMLAMRSATELIFDF